MVQTKHGRVNYEWDQNHLPKLEARVVSLNTLEEYNNSLTQAKEEGLSVLECNYLLELLKKYGRTKGFRFDTSSKQFVERG